MEFLINVPVYRSVINYIYEDFLMSEEQDTVTYELIEGNEVVYIGTTNDIRKGAKRASGRGQRVRTYEYHIKPHDRRQ